MTSLLPSEWQANQPGLQTIPLGDAPSLEYYRQIYVALHLASQNRPTTIGVTSAISGEGRTTVSLGLARALASDLDVPIVLAEADLEHPSLAPHFGLPPAPGLCEVLRGECRLEEIMRDVSNNLSVITTGMVNGAAPRLFHALAQQNPFTALQPSNTTVIVDLPPIINHSYSPLVAGITDALVLVVRAGITPTNVVHEAISRLEHCPPKGIVLNGVRSALPNRRRARPR